MDQPERDRRYFEQLALPPDRASAAHKAALARAHELRRFEIENYWRRSSCLWGFQLVAFGALAFGARDGSISPSIVLPVSVLGALAALTGVLTARGSRFWQANWEAHVDILERTVEGRLHSTVLAATPVQFSVGRVNERFLEILLGGWLLAFLVSAAAVARPSLLDGIDPSADWLRIGLPTFGLVGGAWRLIVGQRSDLRGRVYRRDDLTPLDERVSR